MMLLILLCLVVAAANAMKKPEEYPFQNINLTWQERVDDLVSRLTLEELVQQLSKGGSGPKAGPAPPILRLGIGPFSWNTECLRGVAEAGPATSFPQSLGLSAAFSTKLIYEVAEATAKEARAKFANYTSHGEYGTHKGINCFSPVVNIMRHPLWGRNQETYGEDPYLTSQYAAAFVKGLQGSHPRYIRASANCKHFDVHNGPENIPVSRFSFDANVSDRDWHLTFLPAFYGCIVEGGALGVMCSYNSINGVPACANKLLLTDILRRQWKFPGFVIGDQDALENIVPNHRWVNTEEEAAAAALLAGTNLDLCSNNPNSTFTFLPTAIRKGLITEKDVREAAKPLFFTRMRLGEFDPPQMNPFSHYNLSLIQSSEHRALSLRAAMKTFILLQNRHDVLPLKKSHYNNIAIIGPMANNGPQLFGNFAPTYDEQYVDTPLSSLHKLADNIHYAAGCSNPKCMDYDADEVKQAVQLPGNQVIIICLGTGQDIEREGLDRSNLQLPGKQQQLLEDVIAASVKNITIVLLLFNAGPVELQSKVLTRVDAVIACFFPAQAAGEAVRRVLLGEGENSNPAGRLPYTWPTGMHQVPDMVNYSMSNRTYRYWYQDSPLFPYGYGLSYSSFQYTDLKIENVDPTVGDDVNFSVTVKNNGPIGGDEVIQAYISWLNAAEPMPKLQLVGFERTFIPVLGQVTWNYTISSHQLSVYTQVGFKIMPGEMMLYVGGQQPNQDVNVGSNVLQIKFTIIDKIGIPDCHDDSL